MKRRIFISFALIFSLFTLCTGVTLYYLYYTTSNLRYLIDMHAIEGLRQQLSFNVQKIQAYGFASVEELTRHLDEIAQNAKEVRTSMDECYSCHHDETVEAEINAAGELVDNFDIRIKAMLEAAIEGRILPDDQKLVSELNQEIFDKVRDMVQRAAISLQNKTDSMIHSINRVYRLLFITLGLTFLLGLAITRYLTNSILRPVDELMIAVRNITAGKLGYITEYQAAGEFSELLNTFNEMSASLAIKEKMISRNFTRLDTLNKITLPLHSTLDVPAPHDYLKTSIASMVGAELDGFLLQDVQKEFFDLKLYAGKERATVVAEASLQRQAVLALFEKNQKEPVTLNKATALSWPFGPWPATIPLRQLLIVWLVRNEELLGAILAINKTEGEFTPEDVNGLGILANNIAVALENIGLYRDLHNRMRELKKAQHHLVEAEKLTALGGLAGGVAHDFNNILCGILGHIALLKRMHNPEDRDYYFIEAIEKAGQRAAKLTKQLLAFARQEVSESMPVDINQEIKELLQAPDWKPGPDITITLELAEPLPLVRGNISQLDQMIFNLLENSLDAMPDGGELSITTRLITLDEQEETHRTFPVLADYIQITVGDTGIGIAKEVVSRIFEPFFTTKEFGKGSGLGLAMVYGIVKSHRGVCHVSSEPGKGSKFNIYLPVFEEKEEEEPRGQD